jgi:UDP-2,3-diacylglucosamine pyrophosphatase LpxH
MKRIVVLSDIQAPSHDGRAVTTLNEFIEDFAPDELYCVGDEADSPEPSRWNKGRAEEYAKTLQAGLDKTSEIMEGFKNAIGDKPFHVMRSNHGDRIGNYINKYAPALASLRALEYEELLRYRELDITFHNKIWQFAPGWALAHGDEGSLLQTAGGTALNLARRIGLSVVCGHTHRQGIQHHHVGYNGQINTRLFGVEVGHLMDLSKATYLTTGAANWQQGFTVLYVRRGNVTPVNVPIIGRSFTVEGETYAW